MMFRPNNIHKYTDKKKFTNEVNKATYLIVIFSSFLLLVKSKKKAPIVGSNIKDESIGKFII